jgi:hypothetical protein
MNRILSFNISEKNNCFLWLPVKTASTHAAHIFTYFDFSHVRCDYYRRIIESKSESLHHNHSVNLFDGHEKYKLIVTVRNPYSKTVSTYEYMNRGLSEEKIQPFDVFVDDFRKRPIEPPFEKRKPDYPLRQENLYGDYLKIPFVRDSKLNQSGVLEELCQKKMNTGLYTKPVKDYYNQETANIVYTNYKEYFDLFGYDKDSWKTLN